MQPRESRYSTGLARLPGALSHPRMPIAPAPRRMGIVPRIAFGAWLARRGWMAKIAIGITFATGLAFAIVSASLAGADRAPVHDVPLVASSAIAWGGGFLLAVTASPVVALNRAVALAESHGPDVGLEALDDLRDHPALRDYQPYWAARAELLARVGQNGEAREAYERAMGLESDPSVRRHLERRRAAVRSVEST